MMEYYASQKVDMKLYEGAIPDEIIEKLKRTELLVDLMGDDKSGCLFTPLSQAEVNYCVMWVKSIVEACTKNRSKAFTATKDLPT